MYYPLLLLGSERLAARQDELLDLLLSVEIDHRPEQLSLLI
jgi:hypothetical protein